MSYEYEFVRHTEASSIKFFLVSMTRRLYHWHNDIEILMVTKGSVMLETVNQRYRLSADDIFILNSNEVHSLSKTEENNMLMTIQFDPKFCKAYFPDLQKVNFLDQHITEENRRTCWNEIRKYLLHMMKEYHNKEKCYKLRLMSTLNLLICSMMEHLEYQDSDDHQRSVQKKNLDRLNTILSFVKENYMNKISLKDIADTQGLDMYYLSHFIKKHLGISFQDYLNRVRLEKAVELLTRTDMKKLDICIESGFSDYRYLNNMFKKEFGCTASEYLALNGKQVLSIPERKGDQELQSEVIHNDRVLHELISYLEKRIQ